MSHHPAHHLISASNSTITIAVLARMPARSIRIGGPRVTCALTIAIAIVLAGSLGFLAAAMFAAGARADGGGGGG